MDLGNPIEVVVYHYLIRGLTCHSYQDGFPIASALVYMMDIGQDLR